MLLPSPLRGIIPPLVTPLTTDFQLDLAALDRLLGHILAFDVQGLFLLGTTGEGPGLGRELQRQVILEVCRRAASRVPVLVNATNPSLRDALEITAFSAEQGAVGVALSPPYYFPIDQDELLFFVREFAAQTALPFFLYNMPSHARPAFSLETVRRVAELPKAAGIKDSSGDTAYWQALAAEYRHSHFAVVLGPEDCLVDAFAAGAHGSVCGTGNLRPDLFVALYRACLEQREEDAVRLQASINRLHKVFQVTNGPSGYLRGLKTALSLEGLCGATLMPPHFGLTPEETAQVQSILGASKH